MSFQAPIPFFSHLAPDVFFFPWVSPPFLLVFAQDTVEQVDPWNVTVGVPWQKGMTSGTPGTLSRG